MAAAKNGVKTQGTLFEEDYLRRTLGDHVRLPDVALTELVANAWDAGAGIVQIRIPDSIGEPLIVEDDGSGLTPEEFRERWMCLGYNRLVRQSYWATGHEETKTRKAYGRNGQGRHALLCFADSYEVETWRDGELNRFKVSIAKGEEAITSELLETGPAEGHGTKLMVTTKRKPPDSIRIGEVLAGRFFSDPNFRVFVNGVGLRLNEEADPDSRRVLDYTDTETGRKVLLTIDAIEGDHGRTKHQSGVAFWIGGRLVGSPGWVLNGDAIIDGRTKLGRRLLFVIRTDDMFDEVKPDWTGWKHDSPELPRIFRSVAEQVRVMLRQLAANHIDEATLDALAPFRQQIGDLPPGAQHEVVEIVKQIVATDPTIEASAISAVATTVVRAKQNVQEVLIQRIMAMNPEDQEGLNKLLDEWTIEDASQVLNEVGRRIKVVELLEKLMGDPNVDELHMLHPLVLSARWLFGPEFESPLYASNVTLTTAMKEVFGKVAPPGTFEKPRKRMDLLLLPDSTISAVATEEFDRDAKLVSLRNILILELKKGDSTIGRDEMFQAEKYVDDLLHCKVLSSRPYIHAFVVGYRVDSKTSGVKKVGERNQPEDGRIEAVTFANLVQTANARLFRLRDLVGERYPFEREALLKKLLEPDQQELFGRRAKDVMKTEIREPTPVEPGAPRPAQPSEQADEAS